MDDEEQDEDLGDLDTVEGADEEGVTMDDDEE